MGEQLYGGQIDADPLVTGRSPCQWCDYGFICCHEDGIGERALDAPEKPFEPEEKPRGRKKHERTQMDARPARRHCRPGRCAAGERGGGQRQDRCPDRARRPAHHGPGPPGGRRPPPHRYLYQRGAAELRARIGQALLRRSQAEPGNSALRRQRMLLQRAPICTIDAFCLDLLHKHFQALDIPPDFSPADPGSVETLRAAALSETLEHAYADPDFCAFADLYGKGRTDRAAGGDDPYTSMISSVPCRTMTKSWTNF